MNNALIFYYKALYKIYNNIVYKLFPNSLDIDAESLDTLVPVVRLLSPKEKHNALSRIAYRDLLSKAIKAL